MIKYHVLSWKNRSAPTVCRGLAGTSVGIMGSFCWVFWKFWQAPVSVLCSGTAQRFQTFGGWLYFYFYCTMCICHIENAVEVLSIVLARNDRWAKLIKRADQTSEAENSQCRGTVLSDALSLLPACKLSGVLNPWATDLGATDLRWVEAFCKCPPPPPIIHVCHWLLVTDGGYNHRNIKGTNKTWFYHSWILPR